MRDTDKTHCNHPGQMHLFRLPDILEPAPQIENPSTRVLLVIPLFDVFPEASYVEEIGASAASWARHSWLLNSDAIDYNIEVKIHIEDQSYHKAKPIFDANFVTENDVILFDGAPYDSEFSTGTGKKAAVYSNPLLKDYEWVIMADADMFVVNAKLPFFERFLEICFPDQIGNEYSVENMTDISHMKKYWIQQVSPRDHSIEQKQIEWKRRVALVADESIADRFFDPQCETIAGGGFHAYPAKHFHEHRKDDVEWFQRAAHILNDDEAVIAVWHAMGNPIWNLHNLKLPAVMLGDGGFNARDGETFDRYTTEKIPFLFHFSSNPYEMWWRNGIGGYN